MRTYHHVFAYWHGPEHGQVLERATQAQPGHAMGRYGGKRTAFEQDIAALVVVEPAHAIEQRGLAGAIGADQTADAAAQYIETHCVQRHNAAELHRHVAYAEQCRSILGHGRGHCR